MRIKCNEFIITSLEKETLLNFDIRNVSFFTPLRHTKISHNATVLITKPAALGEISAVLSWRRECRSFLLARRAQFTRVLIAFYPRE